jgi:Zn finger protein HypA/HybF involved in hydrogenase expression
MSDAPIEPQDYLYGVKVVDIGDIRVSRGMTRRPHSSCGHRQQVYDDKERRIWCKDCETELEPFDAYICLVSVMDGHIKTLKRREEQVKSAEAFSLRSRAAKRMDEYWRSHTMAPMCPHCDGAILPDDVVNGLAQKSKSIEIASRKRSDKK